MDGREPARDAIALGAALARVLGAELVLVHVHPPPVLRADPAIEAGELLTRLAADAGLPARPVARADLSPVRGLHAQAEEEGAEALVVGSSDGGPLGRILLGGHTERALQGAPCAVAVAPRGLAGREWSPHTIAVGFDGSEAAAAAHGWARRLADAAGAELRIVSVATTDLTVWDPYAHQPDWRLYEELRRAELDHQLGQLTGPAVYDVRVDEPAQALVRVSYEADLLVLGSRSYGPLRSTLLGGTARRVVREAACPVVVVPR